MGYNIGNFPFMLSMSKHEMPFSSGIRSTPNPEEQFLDSSVLEIAIFIIETHHDLTIEKYRFHYMNPHGQMLFRYDNAPHHPEITSHPHHKHVPNHVIPSREPSVSVKDVLDEIIAIIIGNPR